MKKNLSFVLILSTLLAVCPICEMNAFADNATVSASENTNEAYDNGNEAGGGTLKSFHKL